MESVKLQPRSTKNEQKSCSTSESKHFLASRDLYSTLHALREKRFRSSKNVRSKISKRNESAMLRCEHDRFENLGFFASLIEYSIEKKKKENERRNFPEALLQTVYVRDLGSEYGANKGDWTRIFNSAKKKLRVLSFDSVGACFQRCFFRDD